MYRVKRRTDSEDSEKPTRFAVVTDDEVSEREEVRDSNYIGTDLYWENRFYQIKPFKPPAEEPDVCPSGEDEKAALLMHGAGATESEHSVVKDVGVIGLMSEDITDKEFTMV